MNGHARFGRIPPLFVFLSIGTQEIKNTAMVSFVQAPDQYDKNKF